MDILVHNHQAEVTPQLRKTVFYRINGALERHQGHIDRVQVWLSEEGIHSGEHSRCRISVHLQNGGNVITEETCKNHGAAITKAAAAMERAVRRNIERKRSRGMRAA